VPATFGKSLTENGTAERAFTVYRLCPKCSESRLEAMFFRLFMENHPICGAATATNSVVIPADVT
jgi:hypothetical protein